MGVKNPKALLAALVEGADAVNKGHIHPEDIGELTGLAHSKQVTAGADDVGLAAATKEASDIGRNAEKRANTVEAVEARVRAAADGSTTSARLLRKITKPLQDRTLGELWDRLSPRDVTKIIGEMVRVADKGGTVIHNMVAGAVREAIAKHLGQVRRLVIEEKQHIRALGLKNKNLSFIDTGAMGDVNLPTKVIDAQGRGVALGTDRIVGVAKGNPQVLSNVKFASGEVRDVEVQGEITVTIAIEVKGRTVGAGGLRQVEALAVQGRGTQGYAIVDGKFWLLKYDPVNVHHVIVVKAGHPDVERIKGISKLSGGGSLQVVEIPEHIDNNIMGLARELLKALDEDQKTMKAAKNAAASTAR